MVVGVGCKQHCVNASLMMCQHGTEGLGVSAGTHNILQLQRCTHLVQACQLMFIHLPQTQVSKHLFPLPSLHTRLTAQLYDEAHLLRACSLSSSWSMCHPHPHQAAVKYSSSTCSQPTQLGQHTETQHLHTVECNKPHLKANGRPRYS
jgi:hypothetical protein